MTSFQLVWAYSFLICTAGVTKITLVGHNNQNILFSIMRAVIPASLFLIFFGTACKSQGAKIDAIISKYDTVEFTNMLDKTVFFRGNRGGHSIYCVGITSNECSPYFVEFDNSNNKIIRIDNELVLAGCGNDYLTRLEITNVVMSYVRYALVLISVDSNGNVFINPDQTEEPAILLRAVPNALPTNLTGFEHYRGNWYVRSHKE